MKVAIMQPYFFPYLGYYQLLLSADVFVLYDEIKYTKRGWINRNLILNSDGKHYISLPLVSDSDYLNINQRFTVKGKGYIKIRNQLSNSYSRFKDFDTKISLIDDIFSFEDSNLFNFLYYSILEFEKYFFNTNKIIISSKLNLNKLNRKEDKVIEICKKLGASQYINLPGGTSLYNRKRFKENNIELQFLDSKSNNIFSDSSPPFLSVLHYFFILSDQDLKKTLKSDFEIKQF